MQIESVGIVQKNNSSGASLPLPIFWAITGSSGFIGRALREHLTREGVAVRGLAHAGEDVRGDVRDRATVRTLVEGADVVVHLAAFVHRPTRSAADQRECWSINVDGTRNLLDAIDSQQFLIYVSTTNVYPRSEDPMTERSPVAPQSFYGRSKLEAERLVLERIGQGTCRGVILRPAVVFRPGSPGNLARLIRMIRWRVVIEIAGGTQKKSLLPVETLIDAILAVAKRRDEVNGEIFNVSGGAMTIHDIIEILAAGLQVKPLFVPVPRAALRLLPKRFAALAESYGSSAVIDDSKLKRLTPYAPRRALSEALATLVGEKQTRNP